MALKRLSDFENLARREQNGPPDPIAHQVGHLWQQAAERAFRDAQLSRQLGAGDEIRSHSN